MATSFENLIIWQKAEALVIRIYDITSKFPKEETYNFISQLRRAALSVPANIAEATGRYHDAESIHFMYNARGSAEEVRSLLMSAKDLKYIDKKTFDGLHEDYIGLIKGINGFIRSLRRNAN